MESYDDTLPGCVGRAFHVSGGTHPNHCRRNDDFFFVANCPFPILGDSPNMFEASGYPLPLNMFDVPKNLTSVGEAKWSRFM